ncbi:DUF1573 domain-containing protein [Spirosoma sp. BT702]|uniref:DUF1573 domain-containing protein n=1 Tax=Spirosoma profusum TaxID=2771354 RepID=A0A926XW75_9BACT|nr:DUF1573 domain-containing protein [Spirosoma profusum]MBD2701899.1 DUF1573 domain-containing protein [Spirosoma profusum]
MKRTLFFGSLIVLAISMAMTVPAALFNWKNATHDFGRITQGKPVTVEFAFTNKGEMPLVINRAQGSCGCTGVDYPKAAVLPGQSGVIKATFNAAAIGAFNKTVTVESNAEGGTVVLNFKGEVVKDAASAQ